MARTVPIGEQDFGDLLRDGCFYGIRPDSSKNGGKTGTR